MKFLRNRVHFIEVSVSKGKVGKLLCTSKELVCYTVTCIQWQRTNVLSLKC